MWLGVVFFLIYVGALLVLFFFIGSLDNNHLPEMENLWFGGFFSVALVMGFGRFSFLPFHSSEVFFNPKEGLALKGDILSLLSLLIFVCLVVWNLNSLNWKKNSPLRPFC
jgi:magnesium-transporting ATPase (P-type)